MSEFDRGYQMFLEQAAAKCRCCSTCWENPCGGCQQGAPCDRVPCRCGEGEGDGGDEEEDLLEAWDDAHPEVDWKATDERFAWGPCGDGIDCVRQPAPWLPAGEERALVVASQAGDVAASERLVRAYDRSLRSRAERVFSAADPDLNLDLDDLHQEARRGFLLAARRLPAGVRLMAYAAPYIYGALYRAVRDLGPIVHSGRCRSFGDLCASSPRFEILTLDEERHDYEASREADAPDWLALSGALGRLSPRKRAILEWRYAGDEELKAVGERLGVSHQRASQIEREALHDLRRWLS